MAEDKFVEITKAYEVRFKFITKDISESTINCHLDCLASNGSREKKKV